MMKYALFVLLFCFQFAHAQSVNDSIKSERIFSREELIEDIRYCKHFYEAHHTNLYAYHTKVAIDSIFKSLEDHVYPMTGFDFYGYIVPLCAVINDGHTMFFPPASWRKEADEQKGFFPFRVNKEDLGFRVTMNLSDAYPQFSSDDIITEINGIPADSIYNRMLSTLPREGFNLQYPNWIIEKYFYEYYSYVFGHPDSFQLKSLCLSAPDIGITDCKTQTVAAILKDTLVERRKARYPEYPMTMGRDKGMYFTEYDSLDAAVLSLFTWDKSLLKHVYNIKFKDSIDACLKILNEDSIGTLIIDLRNNQGGFMAYGVYLMQRLADHPFNYVDGLEKSKLNKHGERTYKKVNAMRFTNIHPVKSPYKGKVIILVNGGSFSNSGIFTSQMQRAGRATVIGEETGGSATQLTGSFGIPRNPMMPNSEIEMSYVNYRIIVNKDKPYSGAGVIPDIQMDDDWNPGEGDILLKKVLTFLK